METPLAPLPTRPAGLPGSFRVVRADAPHRMPLTDAALRHWGAQLVQVADGCSEADLIAAVAQADLLLVCYARVTEAVIAAAPRLKAIVKYGVGVDSIDIGAAMASGVPVVNVPDYAEDTVAEGAFALLMALFKRFKAVQRQMDGDGWIWPEPRWLASELRGKTLGLLGLGRIGRKVARMAHAFDMCVLAHDPHVSPASWPATGVRRCDTLPELLAHCDALSIHCVLNQETRHLIGPNQLRLMRPGAYLVNVARGDIVDELALLEALRSGHLGGAGLDVYGQEPLRPHGHPLSALYAMDQVILSPHLSFYTREAMDRLERDTLARCAEALSGQALTVHSNDPRLRAQTHGVRFTDATAGYPGDL